MRFSIVIPTRNRPEYLVGAVKSALAQTDTAGIEVIVFDNASTVLATEALKDICDERLTVARSEEALAMRDSWETAVALATGDFVTVLGDDDALLPNAVKVSRRLIKLHDIRVLRWDRAHYLWPDYVVPALENLCILPLGRTLFKIDGYWLLRELGKMRVSFTAAPAIYNSWIHRDLIAQVKKKTGRLFHSVSPDVDSGFAFAFINRWFHSLNFSLSVAGQSAKSNGAQAAIYQRDSEKNGNLGSASDFHSLNQAATISFDENTVVPTYWGSISTSYSTMATALGVPKSVFSLDKSAVTLQVLQDDLPMMNSSARERYITNLKASLKKRPFFLKKVNKLLDHQDSKFHETEAARHNRRPQPGYDEYTQNLVLECAHLGVYSAEDLATLLDNFLGLGDRFKYVLTDWHPKPPLRHLRDLLYLFFKEKDINFRHTKYRVRI